MTIMSPSDDLAQWFTSLQGLKSACSFNTNVPDMDPFTFANSKIMVVLPTSNQQNKFINAVRKSPGLDLSVADLTADGTFLALLNSVDPLQTFVGTCLQSLAVAPFPSGTLLGFFGAGTTAAFPGGSPGTQWQKALERLTSVIPPSCFTSKLQIATGKTIDASQTTMAVVIKQIAALG
jgi:hypothetical protein